MSKYASLPDIDTAPDVYETPDEPSTQSVDQDDEDYETDLAGLSSVPLAPGGSGDGLDQKGLDRAAARRRFVGAVGINGDATDFSQSLARRQASGRYPLPRTALESSEYSLIPRGYSSSSRTNNGRRAGRHDVEDDEQEEETAVQKLRRLRYEVQELEEVLESQEATATAAPSTTTATDTGGGGVGKGKKKADPTPSQLLAELRRLQHDLAPLATAVGNDNGEGQGLSTQGLMRPSLMKERKARAAELMQQLGQVKSTPSPTAAAADAASGAAPRPPPDENAMAAALDTRLTTLETLLGSASLLASFSSSSPSIDNALPAPLLTTLSKLDHQLSLLSQPRHLDSISRRVKALVTDLERVHEARRKLGDSRPLSIALGSGITVASPGNGNAAAGGGQVVTNVPGVVSLNVKAADGTTTPLPPDALQKLEALYLLLPRIDPLLPLVPHLLSRLRSLSSLHTAASDFHHRLEETRVEVGRLGERGKGLGEVLEGVERSLGENEGTVKGNLGVVGERIEALVERLDKLAAA